ncbi:MAG: hypothetical protein NW223_08125 [Hyphomicrobiaceae bacterium]|nr:hypothetical protein [Hyphomicrobiaceae bacterium]
MSLVLGGVSVPAINSWNLEPGWALAAGASLAAEISKVAAAVVPESFASEAADPAPARPTPTPDGEPVPVAGMVAAPVLVHQGALGRVWQPTSTQQEWLRAVFAASDAEAAREDAKPAATLVASAPSETVPVVAVAAVPVASPASAPAAGASLPETATAPVEKAVAQVPVPKAETPVAGAELRREPAGAHAPASAVVVAAEHPAARVPQRKRKPSHDARAMQEAKAAAPQLPLPLPLLPLPTAEEKPAGSAQVANVGERKRALAPLENSSIAELWRQQPFPVRAAGTF